jgi:GT2 family glycosyltransferase
METLEPESERAELLEPGDDGPDAVLSAPPVVAVVVTRDAGPWLEETLAALAAQDYPSLSVLVLDNGSGEDPTPRIAAAMPNAFVRRRPESSPGGSGFAAAANEALEAVVGAPFLCFCHDDVVPDPDVLRLVVEEAYRSNAGIVGPKLVDHERPEILLEVGMAVDHYGVPFSVIEPDEVDQEQHDGVRDVFFVSHALMLVRTDLFHELGGFDPATFPGADDIDLCWRARLAGARVIVAPAARVRHVRATSRERRSRRPPPVAEVRAEARSRARVLAKSYSAVTLAWVLPVAFALIVAESVGLVLTGRARRGFAVVSGFVSAFAHPGELRRARGETQRLRRIDDADVRDLMIRGSARLRAFLRHRMHTADRLAEVSNRTRMSLDAARTQVGRAPALVASVLAVLVLFGVRSLLLGKVPEVGAFRAWPDAGDAWATFTGGWRSTFLGSASPATPAFGLMAAWSTLLGGHPGLARSLVVGGALPFGAFGAYRLVRPLAVSPAAGVATAVAYAANPLARNAVWRGELGPLVCFALAPFALGVLVRLADRDRPAAGGAGRVVHVARLHGVLGLGLLVAVGASAWPPALALAAAFALAFALAAPFVRDARAAGRVAAHAAAATLVALVLCAPWVWTFIGADASVFGARPRAPLALDEVLRFHTGRAGAGIAAWGIVVAAVVPLFIATGTRLVWAARAWALTALCVALAWLPGRIAPGGRALAPEGVLVGAALGLALAAGLGAAAVADDLRRFRFGWRQLTALASSFGLTLALLGFAADTLSGRFGLDADDWPTTLAWMADDPPPGGFRVLWLGDPAVLPGDSKLAGTAGFALTRDGTGDARDLWAAPRSDADGVVARAVSDAEAGTTARLGHLVAPAGVRYVVFLTRAAPGAGVRAAPQPRLADALARQLDLELSRLDDDVAVYENEAWIPMHAMVPRAAAMAIDVRDARAAALRAEAAGVKGVPVAGGRTATVGPGTLLWSEAADARWRAEAGGRALARRDAFGWTNAFEVPTRTEVRVRYRAPAGAAAWRVLTVLAWVAAGVGWIATRRRPRARVGARTQEPDARDVGVTE